MRLLVDANVPYPIVAYLREEKHTVISVLEQNGNEIDENILKQAAQESYTVVTFDKDFGELVFRLGLPHKGVILLRPYDISYETHKNLLEQFFVEHSSDEIQEHFWVLSENHTRKAGTSGDTK